LNKRHMIILDAFNDLGMLVISACYSGQNAKSTSLSGQSNMTSGNIGEKFG